MPEGTGGTVHSGARLTIDLAALAANYRNLAERSHPAETGAAVKADAYGLGIEKVAPALAAAGCRTFFVALPEEGVRVRRVAPEARIFVLNGFLPEMRRAYEAAGLVPVLNSRTEIEAWAGASAAPMPCAIQVDTGMNRLGLTVEGALALAADKGLIARLGIVLVISHLACGDEPAHPMNRAQLEAFQRVRATLPGVESSLSHSSGIFLGADYRCDVTRPGIALYGGAVVKGEPSPMRNVVTVEARILQVRQAKAGEAVGYGATVTLARDTSIAIASIGYGDGLPRALSGSGVPLRDVVHRGGFGFLAGRLVPILGRISMDLTAFDVTDVEKAVEPGDFIQLIGPDLPLDAAAEAAGTISYELLTSLGRRYERRYIE